MQAEHSKTRKSPTEENKTADIASDSQRQQVHSKDVLT